MNRSINKDLPHTPALETALDLSVVFAVDGAPDLPATVGSYRAALDALGVSYEVFCVIDDHDADLRRSLDHLARDWDELVILGQRTWIDEDAALLKAVNRSRGDYVLTLAGWPEIDPDGLARLMDAVHDADMAVAAREGRRASLRNRVLQWIFGRFFGSSVSDIFCRTRIARRIVLEEVSGFGVRQHFLPAIASELGYSVAEVTLPQADDRTPGAATFVFKPFAHMRALFDALMLYVVLKFLRRPLRFFGAIGLPILLAGLVITTVYLMARIFGAVALADRPGLIFAVLMIVLGIQVIALGLVGEIIVFASNRKLNQYSVKALIRHRPSDR
ncbi:glycosyl transferase family 2 [uncultured Sulfitobacter sp.]|uniref:glycosyl transferase family 2 n=1 Tax=uncultured Sulfitobacter sp. TaxID=191468 RepID=UPI00260EF7B0|nr:glycosyl transferase family 2 [uncultured Sulfitobacter sp.]